VAILNKVIEVEKVSGVIATSITEVLIPGFVEGVRKQSVKSKWYLLCGPGPDVISWTAGAKISATAKQGSYCWNFSKVHTDPRFAHSFQRSVCTGLYNKIVVATSRGHAKS
jgi:hypothetical protein